MNNKIKDKIAKLIDLKSIITLTLIITLEILIVKGTALNSDLFLLFSNILTMVITYFFTKKSNNERSDSNE
ncbi:MAG: hypothetical protein IJZ77_06270 [Bacilli bacterium]|nr:hypothetical protein [Bacilli bacterium]MBQ8473199.1 hypothetical protein [Bacilli bacterium]